ncbi:MAG: beta-galactosidase [Anaeromyxobacter sp.]
MRLVLIFFLAVSANAQESVRGDAFVLMDPRDSTELLGTFLESPLVDGAAIRTSWAALQPEADRFDWRLLDAQIETAGNARKHLTLHILASGYAAPPAWVLERGVQTYPVHAPNGISRNEPLPWDPVFLALWSDFVVSLASHLAEVNPNGAVQNISVGVPVPEMSLVGCVAGVLSQSPNFIRYSRADYLNAWKSSIEAMHKALPTLRKLVSAPVGEICIPDHDGGAFYGEVALFMMSLQEGRFAIFAADANANGSDRLANVAPLTQKLPAAAQFIWSYSNDPANRFQGPLQQSVCATYNSYGVRYFEVYKDDLLNPDPQVREAIASIHSLEQCVPPGPTALY